MFFYLSTHAIKTAGDYTNPPFCITGVTKKAIVVWQNGQNIDVCIDCEQEDLTDSGGL